MRLNRDSALLSLFLTGIVVAIGTFWAFQRGGQDFSVFHSAWRLVIEGRALELYSEATPDRFLYAPGFAWLFSPLGLLPRGVALALWSFLKAAVIGFVIREFGVRLSSGPFLTRDRVVLLGFASWGVLLFARPLLIDFQYGQVNTFILGACVWALLGRFQFSRSLLAAGAPWFVLGALAVTKLFPGPLLLVPFIATAGFSRKQLLAERIGAILGASLVLALPAVSIGFAGAFDLLLLWKDTLVQKGMPIETHNQSLAAFLMHYLSGQPAPVIAQGGARVDFGEALLSLDLIKAISLGWILAVFGFVLIWMRRVSRTAPLPWVAVLVGAVILPSHLIWKPYFVMGIPLAMLAAHRLVSVQGRFREPLAWTLLLLLFAGINLSGFDFVGHQWGARFEAAAILFWCHLTCLAVVLWPSRKKASI